MGSSHMPLGLGNKERRLRVQNSLKLARRISRKSGAALAREYRGLMNAVGERVGDFWASVGRPSLSSGRHWGSSPDPSWPRHPDPAKGCHERCK